MIDPEHLHALADAALAARVHAYAPYSGFAVGAAVLTADGATVAGANFENASYGLSLCAEAVAIASANAAGLLREMTAIAIVGDSLTAPTGEAVLPCGRCRQLLAEAEQVSGRTIAIYCPPANHRVQSGAAHVHSIAGLLPHAFGSRRLGMAGAGMTKSGEY